MIVEELVAVFGAKIQQGEFADAFALFNNLESAITKVLGVIEGAVESAFNAVHRVAMQGDSVAATAEKYGIAAGALQELSYAALLSDSSAEALTNGLKFLGKAAGEAAKGGEAGAEALKDFGGVAIRDATGHLRPAEDLLMDVADSFATMEDGTEKTNRALKLFGRNGLDLIPMLNRGSKGIDTLRAEAEKLGIVLDGDALQAASDYDDAMKRLGATQEGLRNKFATPLLRVVASLFEKIQTALQSPGARRAIDALSVGFERLVKVFGLMIDGFSWFLQHDTLVLLGLTAIAGAFVALGVAAAEAAVSMIASAVATAATWALAAAPLILLGGLIFLIFDDIATYIEGGDSALGGFIDSLNAIDASDSPLVVLLKNAAALLFDLSSPAKWKAVIDSVLMFQTYLQAVAYDFFKTFTDGFSSVIFQFVSNLYTQLKTQVFDKLGLGGVFEALAGSSFGGVANVATTDITGGIIQNGGQMLEDAHARSLAPSAYDPTDFHVPGGASSPTASASARGSGGGRNYVMTANVTVNAETNADPHEIASKVRATIDDHWATRTQEAGAVFSQ